MELWGENTFKVRAYQKASRIIGGFTDNDLNELIENKGLLEYKGIGKNLFGHIHEIYQKGSFQELDDLIKKIPEGLIKMLDIPGLGPKKIQAIYKNLGIKDIESLKKASMNGSLLKLQGFQEKTAKNILKGIELLSQNTGLIRYDIALKAAEEIRAFIMSETKNPVFIAGSLRRFKELVHDIDLVTYNHDTEMIYKRLSEAEFVKEVPQKGSTKINLITKSSIPCDIRIVNKDELYPALHYLTGSKEHNTRMRSIARTKGLKLNEYGIFNKSGSRLPVDTEEDIFKSLGLKQYIPPELREDMGEIEAAMEKQLPKLVCESDIKGIFHCHTDMSDGELSLERIVEIASSMGIEYVGIADHSVSAHYAGGLTEDDLKRQWQTIDNINSANNGIKLLKGIESDILPSGELDYDDNILECFDFVIGSVHTGFKMDKEKMTGRIIKAIENPYLDILGHPTGRLIQKRDPYSVDMIRVIKAAVRNRKCIEINAHPQRMDIDWFFLKKGLEMGLRSLISLDIHQEKDFYNSYIGIKIAQKAWATKSSILNSKSYDQIKNYFGIGKSL